MWSIVVYSFLIVFGITIILSLSILKYPRKSKSEPLNDYLLAGNSLGKSSVISLLLSSSFGLNSLLYQVWLGYSVGAWGLIAQGAWALSFILLSPYAKKIRGVKSLHHLIDNSFGNGARILAGICSIVGIMYLMGWEVAIGTSTFTGIFQGGSEIAKDNTETAANWLTFFIVAGCLFYTVLGGLRGNAKADVILNIFKLTAVVLLTGFLLNQFTSREDTDFISSLFPSLETMKSQIGYWGLITNIAFSIAWQFVDNSTWQSIIGGKEEQPKDTVWNLRWSGIAIFIAPGIIGTILGVSLTGLDNISPDNILSQAILQTGGYSTLLSIAIFIAIIACIMSVIDGLFLASAFALVIDIFKRKKDFKEIDADPIESEKTLLYLRLALIIIGITSIWGVQYLLELLNLSLFNFVYVVIITQLSLIGPVLYALIENKKSHVNGSVAILSALFVGFSATILGSFFNIGWIVDGAGTFTIITSVLIVFTQKIIPFKTINRL